MKKSAKIVAFALIAAAAFTACKSRPAGVAPTFDVIDSEHNLAATTGNFEVTYHFEYLSTLSDQAVLKKIQLAMASDLFGPEYARTGAAESAAAFDESIHDKYGIRSDSTAFHWDGFLHLRSTASPVGNSIVAYTVTRAEDNGGAHGMEQTHVSNYNLRTGARLTLDDLFTPQGKAALAESIRARILAERGAATWEELMTRDCFGPAAEVAATENFVLSATDITFIYNPYDIACYAAGSTRAKLPLANLEGFRREVIE